MNFIPKRECVYLTPADDQAMIDLAGGQPSTATRFMTLAVGEDCDAGVCEVGRIVYLASFDTRHVTQFADGWIVHHSAILVAEEYEEAEARPTATEATAAAAAVAAAAPPVASTPPPSAPAATAAPAAAPALAPRPVQVSRPVAPQPPAVAHPAQAPRPPAPAAALTGPGPGAPVGQQADTGVTTHVTAGPDAKPRTATPPRRAPGTPRRAPQPPRQ